ncbi:hypothetical protein GK047_14700 [Paenibacillus sp. SYP-B3998]|uniref:Uncharacterized protein n=1 Tax=Paenibacillus sp. SYP-B3998 TaxID=2678564 RepID=A0A6G3ZYG1_9BACL|nr:hypothetical protein [Paenibacillus sp. SYP-B3998]NEW07256.1 hypothetical protein [Paenibacillus sp. SYP-B3998]
MRDELASRAGSFAAGRTRSYKKDRTSRSCKYAAMFRAQVERYLGACHKKKDN